MSFLDSLLDGIGDAADEVGAAWSRGFFDVTQSVFDLLGFRTAADNLRRYRSGTGQSYSYSDEEMSRHPVYDELIDRNRTRFESETFVGRSGIKENNALILGLKDGQSAAINDYYDRGIFKTPYNDNGKRLSLLTPDTYFAFGNSSIHSNGGFNAERNGDLLRITGTVRNRFGNSRSEQEAYDFNEGQPGHYEAATLEPRGETRPFQMRYDRLQDVDATLRYDRDPDDAEREILTLLGATWGPLR